MRGFFGIRLSSYIVETTLVNLHEKKANYLWAACILEPHRLFLRCVRLQLIFPANAGIFTCSFACWTSGDLHVVYMRVT